MGIEISRVPVKYNESPGPLTPPMEFDRDKYVSKWAKEGRDIEMITGQREPLMGTKFTADAWQVWHYPKGHEAAGKICKIPLSGGTFVLLYRDKTVQQAVNAIYGNVGKERLKQERLRVTATSDVDPRLNPHDSGILDDATIKARAERESWDGEGEVTPNLVPGMKSSGRVQRPPLLAQRRKG